MSEFEKYWNEANELSTGRGIALRTWSAALAAVEAKMPKQALANYGDETQAVRGWNRCLSEMSERIAALREPSPKAGDA